MVQKNRGSGLIHNRSSTSKLIIPSITVGIARCSSVVKSFSLLSEGKILRHHCAIPVLSGTCPMLPKSVVVSQSCELQQASSLALENVSTTALCAPEINFEPPRNTDESPAGGSSNRGTTTVA